MMSTTELAVALIIALLLFGPDKLPQLARQLGETIAEIKNAIEDKELKG